MLCRIGLSPKMSVVGSPSSSSTIGENCWVVTMGRCSPAAKRELRAMHVVQNRVIAQDERGRQSVVEFYYRGKLLGRYYGQMLTGCEEGTSRNACCAE